MPNIPFAGGHVVCVVQYDGSSISTAVSSYPWDLLSAVRSQPNLLHTLPFPCSPKLVEALDHPTAELGCLTPRSIQLEWQHCTSKSALFYALNKLRGTEPHPERQKSFQKGFSVFQINLTNGKSGYSLPELHA